jgi:fatty acid desaturase
MKTNYLNSYNEKRDDTNSYTIILLHMIFMFLPIYLSTLFEDLLVVFFFFIWFSIFSNGIINLMHECAHRLVFKKRYHCDIFGKWVLAPLLFTDFNSYRDRHWVHHNKFGTNNDTKETYLEDIKGRKLIIIFIECLFLKHALIKFFKPIKSNKNKNLKSLKRIFIVQSLFFTTIMIFNFIFSNVQLVNLFSQTLIAYLTVYIYGLASVGVFISIIRAIAEHKILDSKSKNFGRGALRNLKSNFLTRMIFGSYGFSEHATHHKFPSIPYYNLVSATNFLKKENKFLRYNKGYINTIIKLCKT